MKAGAADLEPDAVLILDHFYLTLQAALDGIGIAMGPTALVADDLAHDRLVAPFPGPLLPARSYCTYVSETKGEDELAVASRSWLKREGNMSNDKQERPTTRKF